MNNEQKSMMRRMGGFTLIELLIGVAIFALVIAIVAMFFDFFFDSYYFALEENRSVDEVNVSLDRFVTELRETKLSEEGAYPLAVADDQEISFFADADNDGVVEKVRYFLNGGVFERGVIEPSSPPNVYDPADETTKTISDFVVNGSNPMFYYYNSDWPGDVINNPLAQADRLKDTRLVEIELVINTSPGQLEDFEVSTRVMLRNLKTEY